MEKRRTAIKRRNVLVSMLLVALAMVIMFATFAPMSARAVGETDGNDISTTEKTAYYLDIPIANVGEMTFLNKDEKASLYSALGNKRADYDVTVILRFNNIVVDDKPILVTGHTKANMPACWSLSLKVNFIEPIKTINIRKTYYDVLKNGDFSNFNITLYIGGVGVLMHTAKFQLSNTSLFTISGINAWQGEDNGDIGDNGGTDNGDFDTNEPKSDVSFLEKFYNWLTSIFKWQLSYVGFKTIIIIACIAIVAFIVYKFIGRVLK